MLFLCPPPSHIPHPHCRASDSNFLLGNAQGQRGYPIVYCSDGFCELTGFTRTEVMQKNCSCRFLHGADTSERVAQQMEKALEGRHEYQAQVHFYRKDGTRCQNKSPLTHSKAYRHSQCPYTNISILSSRISTV